jgi:hypothetical protein
MDSTEPGTLGFSFLDLRRQVRRFLNFQNSIDVARRAPIRYGCPYQKNSRSEVLVVCITILLDVFVPEPCLQHLSAVAALASA